MAAGWNDDGATLRLDLVAQAVGVIGFVSEDLFGLQAIDQVVCRRHVVLLPGAEREAYRQAERIDYSVDFGAKSTA